MAYTKHTWTTQELITSDKLNNIEDGISTNSDTLSYSSNQPIDSIDKTRLSFIRTNNFSNIWGVQPLQDAIIDPRTGYRYLFGNNGASNKTDENLLIIELDIFNRVRSSMVVNHGTDRTSWLHGQFQDFNYFNQDSSKVEFLIYTYGNAYILDYQPNITINFDDLALFTTTNETNTNTISIDFENKILFTAVHGVDSLDNSKYVFNLTAYSITPSGSSNKITSGSVSVDIDADGGLTGQGLSAAPARDFIYDNGSLLFFTAGWTYGNNLKNEMSLRTILFKDNIFSLAENIFNLDNASLLSTSNNRLADFHDTRNNVVEDVKEIEGSSVVNVNNRWVFTTLLMYGRDTTTNSYSQRNKETLQISFGDASDVMSLLPQNTYKTYMGVESDVTNIYTQVLPGKYQISPSLFPNLTDAPVIFQGTTTSETIGGTGLGAESIELLVEQVGPYGRFKQTLTINSYSQLNHQDIVFTRYVRTNRDFGKNNSYQVGRWQMKPMNNIGSFSVLGKIETSKTALLPGYQKFITTDSLSSFFAGDNVVPTVSGMFETLPLELPIENNNTKARILQRFTTYETDLKVYERFISCKVDNYSSIFTQGVGGGYSSTLEVGNWTKLTN